MGSPGVMLAWVSVRLGVKVGMCLIRFVLREHKPGDHSDKELCNSAFPAAYDSCSLCEG